MTRRETVINALRHIETDRLPYHFEFTAQEEEKVLQHTDKASFEAQYGGYLHYFQYFLLWGQKLKYLII